MLIDSYPTETTREAARTSLLEKEPPFSDYGKMLTEKIVPFWMRYGFDDHYGGISNVLNEEGNPINHDKYLWSQGRALWTFSALCRRVEPRPEWRRFADHIHTYLQTHGRDALGRWVYRLDKDGNVIDGAINIYVDGFVLHGLSEYYLLCGDSAALDLALETYANVRARLSRPGALDVWPFVIPNGMKTLDVPMAFSWFFYHLGEAASRPDIARAGMDYVEEILGDFHHPEKNMILQNIPLNGGFSDAPEGLICTPGTVFETMWYSMQMFAQSGLEDRISECCKHLKRHLEISWDEKQGGFPLVIACNGSSPASGYKSPDSKPWWVQVEALVATAYAYHYTGSQWCLDWHERIRQWAFALYPNANGEWKQWLDREGNIMASEALPVKDPFHLPRALICLREIFQ